MISYTDFMEISGQVSEKCRYLYSFIHSVDTLRVHSCLVMLGMSPKHESTERGTCVVCIEPYSVAAFMS